MEHSQSAESLGSSARGAAAGSSFKLRETKEDQSLASRWLEAYATFAFTWPWSLSMGIVAFTLLITAIVGATGVGLTDESDYAWFILKSTRVSRMDAFIEATDQLSDNFEPPERSDIQLRWGYYVTYKAIDGDMLTPANLKTVQETEAMLTNLTGDYFKEWCLLAYNPDGSNACVQPNTWAVQFNKTFPSNQENIDLKKTELYGTEAGNFLFDVRFDGTASGKSEFTRSLWYFASPLNETTYGDEQKDWEKALMDFHIEVDEGMQKLYGIEAAWALASVYTETAKRGQVEAAWFSEPLTTNEFANTVNGDFMWAVFCIIAVWGYMAVHTQSLLLASVGMYEIVISFPIAFFFYRVVFGVKYFQTLQILSVFVMLGIGADDVFVFVDAFKQASTQVGADPQQRLAFACSRASKAILATSMTTAGAFAATIASAVMPIASFGIFACLLISILYLINIALLPPVLVLWSRNFGQLPCCVCSTGCHTALKSTPCLKTKELEGDEVEGEGANKTRWLETFFNTTFSDFVIYSNARYAILTIFTGIFIMGVVYSIRLEPPEEQEAWFSNAHMFTKLDNWRKANFGSSSEDQAAIMNLMWGVEGMDHKGVDYFDAEQRGKLVWDVSFDLAEPAAQEHLLAFCAELRNGECLTQICRNKTLVRNGEVKCVLEDFDQWLQAEHAPLRLPVADRSVFLAKLMEYSQRTQTQAQYANQIGFIAADGDCDRCTPLNGLSTQFMELKYLFYAANSTFQPPLAFKRVNPTYNAWESFMVNYNAGAPPSAANGIQMSMVWMFAETQEALVQTVVQGMAITFSLSFVVLLFCTGNVILSVLSIVTIAGIVTSVLGIGCRLIQGWSLDIPESVAGVILIGFSVDYCVHLAHAYMESSSTLRQERIQDAVTCMGISITAGAATTFMAGVFLFGAVLPFFQKFGFIIVFTIFCSYLWATLFFVAACAVCGPEGDTGDIKALYAQARRLLTGHVKDVPAEEAIQVQGI